MNVMTVTEVVADPQIPVKTDPQGDGTQGFASELSRASNAGETGKDAKAVADQKTASTDQPDRQNGAKEEKDKDTDQANTASLMQGAIPVIMQAQPVQQQPVQTTEQAAGANEIAAVTTAEITVAQAQPGVEQIVAQAAPAEAVQAQQAAGTQGEIQATMQAATAVQTATEGQAQSAEALPEAASQDEKAQAFAKQAVQEMDALQKAAAPAVKQAETAKEIQPQSMQAAPDMQTGEPQVQQTQAEPTLQQADVKPFETVKPDAKETAGQQKQDTAQHGSGFQKQETNTIGNQVQPQVWQPVNGTAPMQFQVPQAQEPVIQQNVVTTIIDNVSTAMDQGKTELTVQLKPEHLGGLQISLTMGDSGLTAKMVTSQENVQNMIQNHIAALQDTLREKGIPVVHMEVVYDQTQNSANFSHNGSNGQWASPQGNGNGQRYKETDDSVNYYNFMSNYDVLAEHGGSVEFSA